MFDVILRLVAKHFPPGTKLVIRQWYAVNTKVPSKLWKAAGGSTSKKAKVEPLAEKVMTTMFWEIMVCC